MGKAFKIFHYPLGLLVATSSLAPVYSNTLPSYLEESKLHDDSKYEEKVRSICHKVTEGTFYLGLGSTFGTLAILTKLGWGITYFTPWSATVGNEFLLVSEMCSKAAGLAFSKVFNGIDPHPSFKQVPASQSSWYFNQQLLSQVPASSDEEKKLLSFLQKRFLAKSTGFIPYVVDWVCPCFGISMQLHPETSHSYARNPLNEFSLTYTNKVEAWKQLLPHPRHFPLLLTRPSNLKDYLPNYLEVAQDEKVELTVQRSLSKLQQEDSKVILDLTSVIPYSSDQKNWVKSWNTYQSQLSKACELQNVKSSKILCIQRVEQKDIGGIRLLPLVDSLKETEANHQYLLKWITYLGLTANRVELDRWPNSSCLNFQQKPLIALAPFLKEDFIARLNFFEQNWKCENPQKTLMVKGTLLALKGLLAKLKPDTWNITNDPTKTSIANISFLKIKEEFDLLLQEDPNALFFDTAMHIEQIHAALSSLLEISSPYTIEDFRPIYRDALASIPPKLKAMTSYGIHSSGMTSLSGIFKTVEKFVGRRPRALFGENTYYECIHAITMATDATLVEDATEKNWEEADLIIAQFNPVLKRVEIPATDYKIERIAETLHKAIKVRHGRPLVLALDCTLDFIDSHRASELFGQFEEEIEQGKLNIIAFRSGLKFDILGMDNYCGAPLYMIHNKDPKWAPFDALFSDPVLQSDRLSLNWFCLAYQNIAPELELYRKQIFDNTRAFLDKIPSRLLYDKKAQFRVIPMERAADPAFVDIKVCGPFHEVRGPALVAGLVYLSCMENGHPIFYRPSLGFYHPNYTMIFVKDCTTIRLTFGLDPAQIDVLVKCFEKIDELNGTPR